MAEVVCGDCGHSFKPGKAPGLAGAAAGAALGAKAGAVIDRLVRMFATVAAPPVAICPECRAAKRKGRCLPCRWPCFWRCPVRGATILF